MIADVNAPDGLRRQARELALLLDVMDTTSSAMKRWQAPQARRKVAASSVPALPGAQVRFRTEHLWAGLKPSTLPSHLLGRGLPATPAVWFRPSAMGHPGTPAR